MADNPTHALIDQLDNTLRGKGSAEAEQRIGNDAERVIGIDAEKGIGKDAEKAQEWLTLTMAVDAVKQAGLYEQVSAVKRVWLAQQSGNSGAGFVRDRSALSEAATEPAVRPGGTVRTMYLKAMRVAAMVFILAGGAAVFKYTVTSSSGLYGKYFTSYVLNTNRGTEVKSALEEAYDDKQWEVVLTLFHAAKEKNNKAYFLTGMADLELKKYVDAIDKFQQVIATNMLTGGDYFQDEAEYYLAMSWLASNNANEAYPLLEKIKANKGHLFHATVAKMSFTDLRIAQYKNHK